MKDIPEGLSLVFEEELQLKILIPDSSQTITIWDHMFGNNGMLVNPCELPQAKVNKSLHITFICNPEELQMVEVLKPTQNLQR